MDLLDLVENTYLPEIWHIYCIVFSTSMVTEYGYSLSNMGAFLQGYGKLPVDHDTFWIAMKIFLDEHNREFARRKAVNNKRRK